MAVQTRIWVRILLFAIVSGFIAPAARADYTTDDIYFDVAVRGTGSATIHARVFNNPGNWYGATVLAVHGFTETANVWGPLADAMFEDHALRFAVRRVIALDMIGHGESSTPSGLPPGTFGALTISDNVSVIIQSIDKLRAMGKGAAVIMGHSMGGLEVQATQEALLSQGSSLAKRGIFGAVLLASVPAAGQQWTRFGSSDVTPFVVVDPVLGTYLSLPDAVAQRAGGWTTLAGTLATNTPSVEQITAEGYNDIEPIVVALQLSTTPPVPRPSVREGAFALRNGTVLTVVSFSQDALTPAVDQQAMYVHLLGRNGFLYRPIVAADAVHSMYISNPTGMLHALRDCF